MPCPFEEQSAKWNEAQKAEYQHILGLADSVEQVSDRYYNGCMKARNARLVELASDYCICYWNPKDFRSGTGQTVRMAQNARRNAYLSVDGGKALRLNMGDVATIRKSRLETKLVKLNDRSFYDVVNAKFQRK